MFERLRNDVERAKIKQEMKHDSRFAAQRLGVKTRKVIATFRTEDGLGLAVYYRPPIKGSSITWLIRVGFDGVVYGEPVAFDHGVAAVEHMAGGKWVEAV